jgi:hypothetical protein
MHTVDIYEPAAGCLTGACGPDEEDARASFESALETLRLRGVEVHRFNLGHDPEVFARNAVVKAAIRQQGMACLPMVLLDGQVLSQGRYPSDRELRADPAA